VKASTSPEVHVNTIPPSGEQPTSPTNPTLAPPQIQLTTPTPASVPESTTSSAIPSSEADKKLSKAQKKRLKDKQKKIRRKNYSLSY